MDHGRTQAGGPAAAGAARLLSDGDSDNPSDIDGDSHDGSEDRDNDARTPAAYAYHDRDDGEALAVGQAAAPLERRTIASVVERYYRSAASMDGAAACALLEPSVARSLPNDYGKGAGPAYLRGARSCAVVLTAVSRRLRAELAAPVSVTNVRVSRRGARAFVGSATMPAGELGLSRSGDRWWVAQMIADPLP